MDPWQLNLRHLRAVAAIARLGRVGAAATAVNLTQPAITQALAGVEAEAGARLFERRPDGMAPTPAAALLVPRIEAALARLPDPRVTMSQVRALIALADTGSYVGAAAATGLSAPSLHRALHDLALVTGAVLVERRGRGLMLSPAARRLARHFRLARAELVAGLGEVAALTGRESGRIAVGAMPLARARLIPRAVAHFLRDRPGVRVDIVDGPYAELVEALRDGTLDILVGALRDPSPGPDVEQRRLFDDALVVAARAGHPLAGAAPDIAAMATRPWVIAAAGTPMRRAWQALFTRAGVAPPPAPVTCGSVDAIRGLLLEGDFLTLLSPDQIALDVAAGTLVALSPPIAATLRPIGLTSRSGWRPTRVQADFIRLIEALA
ncbi:MAG: LysR substrate-binding domain-containing protein [Janthinobacterium lividum]